MNVKNIKDILKLKENSKFYILLRFLVKFIDFRIFNVYRLASLVKENELIKSSFEKEKLIFKSVDKNNLHHITLTMNEQVYKKFNKYLIEGNRGYYVYLGDKVIGYGWVYINSMYSKIKKGYIVIPIFNLYVKKYFLKG